MLMSANERHSEFPKNSAEFLSKIYKIPIMFKKELLKLTCPSLYPRRPVHTTSVTYQKYVTDWRNKPEHKLVTDPKKGEPNYFENEALKQEPAPGYINRLSEIWFDRASSQKDLKYKQADRMLALDVVKPENYLPKVDEMQPRVEYEGVEALKDAPESVKKIFSIKYGTRNDLVKKWEKILVNQVRQHALDDQSLEAQIGRVTATIRQYTHLLNSRVRRPEWLKEAILTLVDSRKQLLTMLREQDASAFEAILKELRIAYVVPPLPEDDPGDARKSWVTHIIHLKTEMIKEERLEKLRLELLEKRKRFNEEKASKLSALDEEEQRLRKEIEELDHRDDELGVMDLRPVGVYRGHTIDCISEIQMHAWMYRPPPTRKPIPMNEQTKKRFR